MPLDTSKLTGGVMVSDGGWSTQLQMRGLPVQEMAESANFTHPELVLDLGRAYVEAGARFLTTNTFSVNQYTLARRHVDWSITELNRRGAELNREAVGSSGALVAGSIGPSGKILAVKEVAEADLLPMFAEQAAALAAGGADVIVLETFSEIAEILIALKAVRESCDLPVVASMSFDSGPQRTRTMMGAKAENCAAALDEAGADIIGCNCGSGAANMLPAVVALRAHTQRPLWVKPNAGMPELEDGKTVWKQTPDEFAAHVPALIEAGANIVGGCCGSGPEHIRKLANLVARRQG